MTRRDVALKHFREQSDYMNDRVNAGIELYRKGYVKLAFFDSDGNPINNISFKAVQKTHDFNFGCNMFMLDEFETEAKNKKYREMFKSVFNYAVAPFYWDALEPEKGKPRYDKDSEKVYRRPAPDLVLEYCEQNNIRVKGHCLVYDVFPPKWAAKNPAEAKVEIRKHLEEVAERYKDHIVDWDIMNELLSWNCYETERLTRLFREEDYPEYCFRIARNLPFQRIFLNEARGIWENFHFTRTPLYMFVKNLINDGVKFDGLGLQFHQWADREDEGNYALERYNPMRVYDVLDTLGKFNKPIQISEITIDSYNGDAEDEEIQAELVENMYKIWFSHPNMDGIVYWNLVDGYTWAPNNNSALDLNSGENKLGGGLISSNLEPKPAFKVLDRLINKEWHTEGTFKTDDNSNIAHFKGFKGNYDIEFEHDGKKYTRQLHLDGRMDFTNKIII